MLEHSASLVPTPTKTVDQTRPGGPADGMGKSGALTV